MPFDILLQRDDLDGLPETVSITDLYEETDDGKYRFVPKIEGVRPASEFDKLNEALRKERNDHKSVKGKYSALGDRDIEKVLAELDEVEELRMKLENAGDIPDDKIEEMVEKRLARVKAPIERDLTKTVTERDEYKTRYEQVVKERDDMLIGSHLGELAAKHCNPDMVRDIVEIGRHYLHRDEDGEIVTKDDSPIPAEEWIRAQLDDRPHWNKQTGGGNDGKGNRGSKAGKDNPFDGGKHYDWDRGTWRAGALAAQDKYLTDHGREAWRAAAEAAGMDPTRPGSAPRRPVANGRAAV